MAKKQATEVVEVKTANVVRFEISDEIVSYAARLGADLRAPLEDRADRAAEHMNRSQRHELATGLLLGSIKAECEHGQFLSMLEERGFEERSARRAMQYAQFILSRSDDEREFLVGLPKTKVMALAGADLEVVDDILENADGDIAVLGVRQLRLELRRLQAEKTNAEVDRDKAVAERDGLSKQLRKRRRDEEDNDGVPLVIADVRAEAAALVKKAELALTSLYPLGVEMAGLGGHDEAGVWVQPSMRLALSGLVALRVQMDGLIGSYVQALGDKADKLKSHPDSLAFLDASEIKTVAEDWERLTALHQHEAALRAHERDQAKPKGKGRPKAAPEAPKV